MRSPEEMLKFVKQAHELSKSLDGAYPEAVVIAAGVAAAKLTEEDALQLFLDARRRMVGRLVGPGRTAT